MSWLKRYEIMLYLACVALAIIIIVLFAQRVFDDEPILDKHIREMKYEQQQIYKEQNSLILKKLEDDNGSENTFYQEVYGQKDGLAPEGR